MYEDRGGRPAGNDPYRYAKSGLGSMYVGDGGGKGVGSSGHDEETEHESTVCTGNEVERRQDKEYGGGIQDAARRRRRKE